MVYGMVGKEGEKRKVELKQPSDGLIGLNVEMWLLDGGRLRGRWKKDGERELVREGRDGEVVVFKHAVAYIIPLRGVLGDLNEKMHHMREEV